MFSLRYKKYLRIILKTHLLLSSTISNKHIAHGCIIARNSKSVQLILPSECLSPWRAIFIITGGFCNFKHLETFSTLVFYTLTRIEEKHQIVLLVSDIVIVILVFTFLFSAGNGQWARWPNASNFCLGPPEIITLWTLVAQIYLSGNSK